MAFGPSTLHEIRIELESLHRFRAQIDERVKALEAILSPLDLAQVGLPFQAIAAPAPASPARAISLKGVPAPSANNGLRSAVLGVLRSQGPKRAPEVAAVLSRAGFQNDGATPLTTRVYNDLWRLSQRGVVSSQDGVFALKEETRATG